jgi:hypothetical protein
MIRFMPLEVLRSHVAYLFSKFAYGFVELLEFLDISSYLDLLLQRGVYLDERHYVCFLHSTSQAGK